MKTFYKILQNENAALRSQDTRKLVQFAKQKDDAMRYISYIIQNINSAQDLDRGDVRVRDLFDNLSQVRDSAMVLLRQNTILARANAGSYKRIIRNLEKTQHHRKKRDKKYEDIKKGKKANVLVRKFFDDVDCDYDTEVGDALTNY
ncbi:hypothetical protein [Candidatus Sarmatiella mevalonica]|uniref:hypothetical protein n=1 Tax=Candidatus Sarmatiella mevalonica TaxID=2770581 RepID=UPI001920DB48|nr:hypothetical protein [Candidatus Sarmatiella mevalonica]